jgi:hypothetical protein
MSGAGSNATEEQDFVERAIASLESLRSFLGNVAQTTCQLNLVKSNVAPKARNTRYLDMTTALADKVKETTRDELRLIVDAALNDINGVADFSFQAFADGRIAALPHDRYAPVLEWLGKFPPADTIEPFANGDNHVENLKFIHTILVKAPEGDTLRVFRKASYTQVTKRKGLIAMFAGDTYDYVDPGKSLILDMKVDFFLWDNIIFVSDYKKLESILDFREITRSVATQVYESILATLPAAQADELRQIIMDGARRLNKLASMHQKPHLPMLDMARAKAIIENRGLPIVVEVVDGIERLSLDPSNIEHITAYLHILGDDYVESQMTAIAYIATEKEV